MLHHPSIVMVNYLNSKPFEYGLKNYKEEQDWKIITATPATCAQIYKDQEADIALLPVGALHNLHDYEIITDYCIGCNGEVRTVCIFSNEPLEECHLLHLDTHSLTSILLSKLLTTEYLGLDINYRSLSITDYAAAPGEAVLMIGDKVFEYENSFRYKYDLGALWKDWTGLPFVFALWIKRKGIDEKISLQMNTAFEYGISHLPDVISLEKNDTTDLYYYFSHHIQYKLDDQKRQALQLFLEKSAKFQLQLQ